jgi:hypothetical protein
LRGNVHYQKFPLKLRRAQSCKLAYALPLATPREILSDVERNVFTATASDSPAALAEIQVLGSVIESSFRASRSFAGETPAVPAKKFDIRCKVDYDEDGYG